MPTTTYEAPKEGNAPAWATETIIVDQDGNNTIIPASHAESQLPDPLQPADQQPTAPATLSALPEA